MEKIRLIVSHEPEKLKTLKSAMYIPLKMIEHMQAPHPS